MNFRIQINNLLERLAPLLDWWFAGVLVSFYWIANNLFDLDGEELEWATYFFAFVFALNYYLVVMRFKLDRKSVV